MIDDVYSGSKSQLKICSQICPVPVNRSPEKIFGWDSALVKFLSEKEAVVLD
ncbi:hypothetical protein YC2023_030506 [Brassica napus]